MSEVTIPRTDDGAIDYAALGSELEHCGKSGTLAAFWRKFDQSTDAAMRALATFAHYRCTAVCERRAGRIDAAMLAEANAETVYQREIRAENRW